MGDRKILCIVCPMSCIMNVSTVGTGSVLGARCSRGVAYAKQELAYPMRMFSTSIPVIGGNKKCVSVRPSRPVPKASIAAIIRELSSTTACAPITAGDRLFPNVCGTSVDIVALHSVDREQTET